MLAPPASLSLAILAHAFATSHPEAPPPAHTGGFGEPTCHECHFGFDPDPSGGAVRIEGAPRVVTAGSTRMLTVVLENEGMAVAGFQLSARFNDGRQAGAFRVTDSGTGISMHGDPTVEYVHHTREGIALTEPGTRRWTLSWTAPAEPGDVVFHMAALAGDDDDSPFGDVVRTAERRVGVVREK